MENVKLHKKNRHQVAIKHLLVFITAALILAPIACTKAYKVPDLGGLYNSMVQNESPYRNPVILIPGLMGSKLIDKDTGSVDMFVSLVEGFRPATFLPYYPAAVLGTMPSLYELLPRSRHKPVLDENKFPIKDILDPELWIQKGWGLANPKQDSVLRSLFYDIKSSEKRRELALNYLRKALHRARQFSTVMDIPAKPPTSLRMLLVAGDSEKTNKTVQYDSKGGLSVIETGPGDDTVLRSSALGDERSAATQHSRLISPIQWHQVLFLFSNHLDLTKHPAFTDNLLYFLLESQKD